jgi:hypothetical protein
MLGGAVTGMVLGRVRNIELEYLRVREGKRRVRTDTRLRATARA